MSAFESDKAKFVEHLRNQGIEAVWEKGHEEMGLHTFWEGLVHSHLVFKIKGFNLNQILIVIVRRYQGPYDSLDNIGHIIFGVDHYIEPTEGESLIAKTKAKMERPLLADKCTGLEWVAQKKVGSHHLSNRICEALNQDVKLNDYLLSRFRDGMPDLEIRIYREEEFIGIKMGSYQSLDFDYLKKYTSKKDLEAFDAIAKHIKEA